MSKYTLSVSCTLCSATHETVVELPAGWSARYDGSDDETGLCPKHSAVSGFVESQCPGCVSGWGECGLFSAFAYEAKRTISKHDLASIERGLCPYRVNGTFSVGQGVVEVIDLRGDARSDSAAALAQAIRDYCREYPSKSGGEGGL